MAESGALPLAGLTVIELSTSIAGPTAGLVLAELGAEVLKVEPPGAGDDARKWGPPFAAGASTAFNAFNRNKRSLVVDLKDEKQRDALKRVIAERADIVLQNLRPGAVDKLGVGAEALRAEKPSLIYCNIGAFGAVGPLRTRNGYDPLMQAFSGIMSVTGEEGRPPVRVGPSIVDQGAGMWAVIAILAALHRRHLTGEGCVIDTSLYEVGLNWVMGQISSLGATGRSPGKMGSENAGMAPYKAFEARDGWLVIAAGNDGLFRKLCDVLRTDWSEDDRFRHNPDRVTNRLALNALVAEAVAPLSRDDLVERLTAAGVPCAPVLELEEVVKQPQFQAVGILQDTPDGELSLVGLPISFDGSRPPLRRGPPSLGEATAEILGPLQEAI